MYTPHALPPGPADRLQKLMSLLPSRSVTSKLLALTLICVSFFDALAWQTPASVGLRIIVVSSPTEAQQILDRLAKGKDFAALAKAKSTDPTADGGGFMGRLDPASLRPELRDALQGLSPGQLTGVIKIPSGYAILQIMPEEQSTAGIGMSSSQMLPLTGRGSVRYTPDISGAVDMELAFRKVPKPDDWNRDFQAVCETRKRALAMAVQRMEGLLDPDNPQGLSHAKPADVQQAHYALAQFQTYSGNMEAALEHWQAAYRIAQSDIPGMVPQMQEILGTAYLHKSEMENDVYREPGDRCIFPPGKSVSYKETADSEKAIQYFTKYLEQKPDDVEVKWLLNLAYMTLGKYPAGVPAKYLISPSAFQSKETIGRFVDVAPAAGLDKFSMAGGTIVDDFDNDGLLDVVTSSYYHCEPLHFFHNNGDGTFTDRAAQAGLGNQLGGLNIIQADYDNNGCMDILVPRGAWQFPLRLSLLRNNCDGTFTDVTRESGLGSFFAASQAVVWLDIDNDGFLDLFVGNEQGPSYLFHNRGDGIFEDISHSAGVDRVAVTKGVAAADYDNDGYTDLYVSNLTGNNFLYHNNHDGTFIEVAQQAGVQQPLTSFAAWFFDYDNDGWPDLFVTSYYMSVEETVRTYLGLPHNAETLKLYRNLGSGKFQDVTKQVGLDRVYAPMGSNFGDVDNDGFLDIYLGTGLPTYAALVPNVLLRNHDGKYFVDVTASSGTGELHKGHGVAFADIDNDGDEDLFAEIGGAAPGDAHTFRLFENPGNGNDWLSLHLIGVKTNRAAIGARIKVTVENQGQGTRSIYRTVSSGGSFGASPLQQHIGLGKSARILNLEIWWPTSNTRQNFTNVGKNQFLEIKEFAKDYAHLERKPYRLGGARREAASGPFPGKTPSRKQ